MTVDGVRKLLRQREKQLGTREQLAAEFGCAATYIYNVQRGKQPPGPVILKGLGMRKVVSYEMVK
jgi:hypothetical protein